MISLQFPIYRTIFPILCGLLLLLSGCSTLPRQAEDIGQTVGWELRQQQLNEITEWSVEGRAAFRVSQDGGQSSFRWNHAPSSQQFTLAGVLGMGALELKSGPSRVRLITGTGEVIDGEDAEQLLFQATGWLFPVDEAGYWIRGIPAPTGRADSMVLDQKNRLQSLSQSGWNMRVRRYQSVDGVELPALVVMERDDVRVKLSLVRWRVDY